MVKQQIEYIKDTNENKVIEENKNSTRSKIQMKG
jgi:hypothetical protein